MFKRLSVGAGVNLFTGLTVLCCGGLWIIYLFDSVLRARSKLQPEISCNSDWFSRITDELYMDRIETQDPQTGRLDIEVYSQVLFFLLSSKVF